MFSIATNEPPVKIEENIWNCWILQTETGSKQLERTVGKTRYTNSRAKCYFILISVVDISCKWNATEYEFMVNLNELTYPRWSDYCNIYCVKQAFI